jgi:NTP pyrophosphatase (non-canonical NTP hydrolase)
MEKERMLMLLRKEIKSFSENMERKLKENDYKEHWSKSNYSYLIQRLHEEVDELDEALSSFVIGQAMPRDLSGSYSIEQYGEVVEECADVANFAMMIADNLKNKRENDGDVKYFTRRVIRR